MIKVLLLLQIIEEPWDDADIVSLRLRHESFKPFLSKVPQPGHAKRILIYAPGTVRLAAHLGRKV